MRPYLTALAAIGLGTCVVALADPPASSTNAPASPTSTSTALPAAASTTQPPVTSTPVSPGSTTTTAAAPQDSDTHTQLERHFLSKGYHVEMRGGQKLYCRREQEIGSRLGGTMNCDSLEQLKANEDATQAQLRNAQRSTQKPGG